MAEPSIHKREEEPKVSLIPLIALIFYNVSGGPFGVEDSVRAAGPLLAILGFIIFPFFWSVPEAMVTAELSTAFPVNGGYVMWISEAFGPFWGFQGGFWKWLSGMIDNALYPVLFLDYIKQSAPIFASGVIRTLSIWFITFALTYLNYRGLTVVGYVAVGLAVVSLVPFVLMGVLSIPRIKPSRWLITDLNTVHWRDYLNNLFWNLNYWDKASTLAGEVKNPSETFPKALYFAIPAVVCSYLVPLLAGTGAVAFSRSSWEDGYFATVGLLIGGRWLRMWIQGAAALSNMGLFEAEMSSDSYQLLGMAENGMLPKFFARRSVHGTPVYGIAFSAFGVLALSWMSFQEIVEFLNFLYGFGMLLELAAFVALRYGRPDIRRPYKAPVGNTGSVLVCLPPAVLLLLVMGFATVRTLVVSFGVLVMGFLLYGVLEVSKRRKWLEYAEESPEDASSALLTES